MVKLTANWNPVSALRMLARLERDIEEQGRASLEETGKAGQAFAQLKAPKKTGILIQNIQYRVNDSENTAVVVATNPFGGPVDGLDPTRYPGRSTRNFDLVRYMHQNPGAANWSEDPQFMYATRRYLQSKLPATVTGRFRRVIIKYQ